MNCEFDSTELCKVSSRPTAQKAAHYSIEELAVESNRHTCGHVVLAAKHDNLAIADCPNTKIYRQVLYKYRFYHQKSNEIQAFPRILAATKCVTGRCFAGRKDVTPQKSTFTCLSTADCQQRQVPDAQRRTPWPQQLSQRLSCTSLHNRPNLFRLPMSSNVLPIAWATGSAPPHGTCLGNLGNVCREARTC